MKGIGDTISVQKITGERLRSAREYKHFKRPEFVEALSAHHLAPIENRKKGVLSVERLKQWEYGNNPISLEWLPAIFDVLDIDAGYLFGQYSEKNLYVSQAVKETGLSESAILSLREAQQDFRKSVFDVPELSRLLVSGTFWEMVNRLAVYRSECNAVVHRPKAFIRAKGFGDVDKMERARSDYKFAVTDKQLALFEAQKLLFKIADSIEAEVNDNAINPAKAD